MYWTGGTLLQEGNNLEWGRDLEGGHGKSPLCIMRLKIFCAEINAEARDGYINSEQARVSSV